MTSRPPPRRNVGRDGVRERPKRRYPPRRRICSFCVEHAKLIDYKDVPRLRRYVSDRAKIDPRRRSGVCPSHQRSLRTAIKRARFLALLPFTPEHSRPMA